MKAVAITGASGFIGRHLVNNFCACRNRQIRVLVRDRSNAASLPSDALRVYGDLLEPETLFSFLCPDCIVINLAYQTSASGQENLEGINNLTDACIKMGISRLVHLSTAAVAGAVPDTTITEKTPCEPKSDYEVIKLEIEQLLSERSSGHFELAILRPTAVFGAGGKNLIKLAECLRRGNLAINYLRSCLYGRRKLNLVCLDNVVSALKFLAQTPTRMQREIFIISDDDSPLNNYSDVEQYLIKRLGYRNYPFSPIKVPELVLSAVLRVAKRSNTNPKRVYCDEKLASFGFRKAVSFETQMESFADWYGRQFRIAE